MDYSLHIFFILILLGGCSAVSREGVKDPPSHQVWDALVKQHVNSQDMVDYKGMLQDKEKLVAYLDMLSAHAPGPGWSRNEKLAYWINAYNAFTVQLIIDHYPLKSIKELQPALAIPGINTVWHKKFFKIGGKTSSLDEIEHDILRKEFEEPRIHFAINCASFSCPPIRNEAYVADKLESQLQDQAVAFVNDPKRNKITPGHIVISRIFSWFSGDFTKKGSLINYLNQYSKIKINPDAEIDHMDYDWSLNDVSNFGSPGKPID